MKQEAMHLVEQVQLAPQIYELTLAGELVKEMNVPGQFLHIKVPREDLILRRPISIHEIAKEKMSASLFTGQKVRGQKSSQN